MATEWVSVSSAANYVNCDFCDEPPVGWLKVRKQNRSLGGVEAGFEVYMCCPEHMKMHGHRINYGFGTEAVYPRWKPEPQEP